MRNPRGERGRSRFYGPTRTRLGFQTLLDGMRAGLRTGCPGLPPTEPSRHLEDKGRRASVVAAASSRDGRGVKQIQDVREQHGVRLVEGR